MHICILKLKIGTSILRSRVCNLQRFCDYSFNYRLIGEHVRKVHSPGMLPEACVEHWTYIFYRLLFPSIRHDIAMILKGHWEIYM